MYTIKLPIDFSGHRYGMEFFQSVGVTDDARIADMMRKKGFIVEEKRDEAADDKPKRGRRPLVESGETD